MNGQNNSQNRAPLRQVIKYKQFQIRACAHYAYLPVDVRALGAETRNIVIHRDYFKHFNFKVCIFCSYIAKNNFKHIVPYSSYLSFVKVCFLWSLIIFEKLANTNMCEYDVETTLKRRCIYNVRSATLFQR